MSIRFTDLALLADGIRNNRNNFTAEVIENELWASYTLNPNCILQWYVRDICSGDCADDQQEDVWNYIGGQTDVEDDIYDELERLAENGDALPTP